MQVHPAQISPAEPFDIFYFLRNHTDEATYYIRARVYDVRSGELLATHDLSQSATNARLFIKSVQAPPDPTGYGRNIVAIATVYTDAGYSTKSPDYEEQEAYYLIKAAPAVTGGGGISSRHMREIIEEVLDEKLKKLPSPAKPEPVPYDALFGAIGALQREINRVPKDLPDASALEASIADIRSAIEALPAPERLDLSPVLSILSRVETGVAALRQETKLAGTALLSQLQTFIQQAAPELLSRVEAGISDLMSKQELTIPLERLIAPRATTEAPAKPDLSHLMRV